MITNLEINREFWVRGAKDNKNGYEATALLNEIDLMCCLGFEAIAQGFPKAAVRCVDSPRGLIGSYGDKMQDYMALHINYGSNNRATNRAMDINDRVKGLLTTDYSLTDILYLNNYSNRSMTESLREEMLTLLFKNEWNIDLTFTGPFQTGDPRNAG